MNAMEFTHKPVLLDECIDALKIRPDGVYVDGTLGRAGHSREIAQRLTTGRLLCIDRDMAAIDAAKERLAPWMDRVTLIHGNFSELGDALREAGIAGADGMLFDLGVSSPQLDDASRGFSYMQDAPLDMRMNADDSFSAYDVVNGYSEKHLAEIIKKYGEERWASRISNFIVNRRKQGEITSTGQLVDIIKAAIPASARREGPHPAKRTFQAIRIEVNEELTQLEKAVTDFMDVLNPGGRLCIITFHSLEDRIVKEKFNERLHPCTCPKEFPICVCGKTTDMKKILGKPMIPTEQELELNPRARSAKLRVIEKL